MLQSIHDNLKGIFAMVIIGLLAVVFIFWGVEFVSVGGLTATQGISVNGEEVDATEVRRAYQDELTRYQVALGTADVPEEIRSQIRQGVLDGSIRNELIRQRTSELRLRATDAEVLEALRQIPAFQVDGQFSKDAYYAALRSANIEPVVFEAQQKQFVAARQLDRGIFASAFVLPDEFSRRIALDDEDRELAWVVIPAGQFVADANPDEAAIEQFYEQNKAGYRTDERANLKYVELDLADVANEVTVNEDLLRAFYEDNIDRYRALERRRARHILITSDGDDAAAEARAQAAYERAAAGEDFAALAAELSADPGSASAGGDLGWAEKSTFTGPFAEAVWSMQPGEIRGPVRTEFGWHVIRLDDIEPGEQKSFEEVRAELEPEYRRSEAERLFGDMQEQLDTRAFESGGDLDSVAAELALPVRTLEGFTRNGGGVLGASPDLIAAVFEPEVLRGEQLRTVALSPGRVVSVKVVAHEPPRDRPLDEVRDAVTAALKQQLARQQAAARAAGLVAELRSGAEWSALTAPWADAGSGNAGLRFVGRDAPLVPPAVLASAFKAPAPTEARVYDSVELPSGDAAVWVVAAVRPGSPARLSPAERAQAMREARERSSFRDASVYVDELRAGAEVQVNPQLFE